jgi:hypothetical protein
MTSAVETESRIADWQQEKSVLTAQDKRRLIRETLAVTREKLTALRKVLENGDQQLVALRADEIVSGNRKSERHDTLAQTLADATEQIRRLEREEQALLLAEQTVSSAVHDAERQARAKAGERLLAVYRHEVEKLKTLVEQAQTVNERLIDLDAQLKKSGLAETGAKSLVLLSRSGSAWNALSDKPILGNPIHVTDWLKHIDTVLPE